MTYPRTLILDTAPQGGFVLYEDNILTWAGDSPPDLVTDRASDDVLAQQIVKGIKNSPSKIRAIQIFRAATGYNLQKTKALIDEHYGPYDEAVTLTLTPREAETLRRLLGGHITGPDDGPRGILDQILRKLPDYPPNPFQTLSNHTLYLDKDD